MGGLEDNDFLVGELESQELGSQFTFVDRVDFKAEIDLGGELLVVEITGGVEVHETELLIWDTLLGGRNGFMGGEG
jgi:hypothetical protein